MFVGSNSPNAMTRPHSSIRYLNALKDLRLRLFAGAAFLSSVAVSTLLVFQVPTMTWAGASAGTAALLASLRGLMQLAGRIPLLAAINRYTASRLIVIARVLLGISALFLLGSGNIALALIYIVLAGVTIGALSALDGVVAREIVQPEVFGTVMGGIGLVATIGGSLGPIFAGWLRDYIRLTCRADAHRSIRRLFCSDYFCYSTIHRTNEPSQLNSVNDHKDHNYDRADGLFFEHT